MATFETTRFGILEYDAADVIEISDGLIGLPSLQRWLLLDMDDNLPMRWLQSLDRPDFGVPVMPPVFFDAEFEIASTTTVRRKLSTAQAPDLVTLIIATVHAGGEKITGNLRAPLLIDTVTRKGAQLALEDDRLSTRMEIDYFKFGLAVTGESAENDALETNDAAPVAQASHAVANAL